MNNINDAIMRKASTTYYYTALFFPKEIRQRVLTLYAFVRTADDFVDSIPQQKKAFLDFEKEWYHYTKTGSSTNRIISNYGALTKKLTFNPEWTRAFLNSMKQDLSIKEYKTIDQTEKYIFGSAEVIGLMMARILGLSKDAEYSAQMQGKAMQYINFLRDIQEDTTLGRTYLPREILNKFNLPNISQITATNNPDAFRAIIRQEIQRYKKWQMEAEKGYGKIPKRFRIPITTAAAMYSWTADQIYKDPFIVFEKKVKPSVPQILYTILLQSVR
jgi:phytoene synthase